MAYIQTISSGPWYTGNTYNLTPKQVEVLWILASLFVAAGWRVVQSGDGLSTYSTSDGSAITNVNTTDTSTFSSNDGSTYAKIAGSIANDRAWLVLKTPAAAAAQGELGLQLISAAGSALSLRAKFSAGGFVAASHAQRLPAATGGSSDQVVLLGGGTDTSPTGTDIVCVNGGFRFNGAVDDSTATPRAWATIWDSASDTMRLGGVWDFVTDLLTGSDTYPYVVALVNDDWLASFGDATNIAAAARGGATRFGGSGTTKVALLERRFTEGTRYIEAIGVNSLNSREDTIFPEWARPAAAGGARGLKGTSSVLRLRATARSSGDNLTTTITREFMHSNGLWVPWSIPGTAGVR
jgi:hypothetical protein